MEKAIEKLISKRGLKASEVKALLESLADLDPEVVAEVLETETDLKNLREKVLMRMAMRSFKSLLNAIEKVGVYGKVRFKDPRIYEVIEVLGGWERIFEIPVNELRREFFRFYPYTTGKHERVPLAHGEFYLQGQEHKALGGKSDEDRT